MRIDNLAMEIGAFVKSLTGLDLFAAVDIAYDLLDSGSLDETMEVSAMVKLVAAEMGATI